MIETIKDRTTLRITNEPGRLQLDFSFDQRSNGTMILMFSFDLGKLYEIIQLIDDEGSRWITNDMGKTWVKTEKEAQDVVEELGAA